MIQEKEGETYYNNMTELKILAKSPRSNIQFFEL
jgi:hypothetical protein